MQKFYNKNYTFTLAELMVIMAVLTVLLAAFAPIFTARYRNAGTDNVWNTVPDDNNNDIYYDAPSKSMLSQAFIGITPEDGNDVRSTEYFPFSKLIIRASDSVGGSPQKHIQFNYGGPNNRLGYLFAGNRSVLFGGLYDGLTNNASENTAFGIEALNSITSGKNNTAIGYKALNSVTTGSDNTVIGYNAVASLTANDANTVIGYNNTGNISNYNTVVGNNAEFNNTSYTTSLGNNIKAGSSYNVALGYNADVKGSYNTSIGYNAGSSDNSKSYVTAIGSNSCKHLSANSEKKTCIANEGVINSLSNDSKSLFNDSEERIFIGPAINSYAAILEVHNVTGDSSLGPVSGMSSPSVIVNGNLVVRGQPYLTGNSPYSYSSSVQNWGSNNFGKPALMNFYLMNFGNSTGFVPLAGEDGSSSRRRIDNHYVTNSDVSFNRLHSAYSGHQHCICTFSCNSASSGAPYSSTSGVKSYDWSSFLPFVQNSTGEAVKYNIYDGNSNYFTYYSNYNSGSSPVTDYCGKTVDSSSYGGSVVLDSAHGLFSYDSCCPILNNYGYRYVNKSSDLRLKNIGSEFKGGIDLLSKLNFYNFTFKSDRSKALHVGVIAQSLQKVFPNSVSKDENGYYKIRWDEMFYSALNSVKELNAKIDNLISRYQIDKQRIEALKMENSELNAKLDSLISELDNLEK